MTPAQCRAARALIEMSPEKLAGHAVVPTNLIADFEAGNPGMRPADVKAIQQALEHAGVSFIAENGGGTGVRDCEGMMTTNELQVVPSGPLSRWTVFVNGTAQYEDASHRRARKWALRFMEREGSRLTKDSGKFDLVDWILWMIIIVVAAVFVTVQILGLVLYLRGVFPPDPHRGSTIFGAALLFQPSAIRYVTESNP